MKLKMNFVIPMAGAGARFLKSNIDTAKPFYDLNGKKMIERVLDNLHYPNAHYILIALQEHLIKYAPTLEKIKLHHNPTIIGIEKITDGSACTVLAAHRLINNDTPLLLANSDQIVDINISDFIEDCYKRGLDGSILTFKNNESKWSYVKTDEKGYVIETKEKVIISEHATVGIYFFKQGSYFVDGVMDMISRCDKTNNEYYTCPVYNHLIKQGYKIGIYEIEPTQMHGIGTPEDLHKYLINQPDLV